MNCLGRGFPFRQMGDRTHHKKSAEDFWQLCCGDLFRCLPVGRKLAKGQRKLLTVWHGVGRLRGFTLFKGWTILQMLPNAGRLLWRNFQRLPTYQHTIPFIILSTRHHKSTGGGNWTVETVGTVGTFYNVSTVSTVPTVQGGRGVHSP